MPVEQRDQSNLISYSNLLIRLGYTSSIPQGEGLLSSTIKDIVRVSRPGSLSPGNILYNIGDSSSNIYLLTRGHLFLSQYDNSGHKETTGIVDSFTIFGEEALHGIERVSEAKAVSPCNFYDISMADWKYLIKTTPHMQTLMYASRIYRSWEEEKRVAGWKLNSSRQNVAKAILDILDRPGIPWQFTTHSALANLSGMNREHVSRIAGDFQREGILAGWDRQRPSNVDIEALKNIYLNG